MGKLMLLDKEIVLAEDQLLLYSKIISVIDRNPNLDGRTKNHNDDFCLIKTKLGNSIEITRNFALKLQHIANYNYKPMFPPLITVIGKVSNIAVAVKVWDDRGEVTEMGGCSTSEIHEKNSSRAFHDALAIAVTRGLKRGLEAKAGLPFINIMIKELFGGYEIQGRSTPKMRNVTGSGGLSENTKKTGNEIHEMLKEAKDVGLITSDEVNRYWNEVMVSIDKPERLKTLQKEIEIFVRDRDTREPGNG